MRDPSDTVRSSAAPLEPPSGRGRRPRTATPTTRARVPVRPRPTPSDEPIDLVAVQADDELINALSAGPGGVRGRRPAGYDADDRVAAMLAAWRAEVDAEPIPELVDMDPAVAAVRQRAAPVRPGPPPAPR